jgi:hypothetical protein
LLGYDRLYEHHTYGSKVFDRKYLVEYPYKEIWLSEAEAWLSSDGLKFYTDGSLFDGRAGSGVFFF